MESDDGLLTLVAIAFVGSVFSARYASARRRQGPGAVDPTRFPAMNAALYGRRGARWCLSEHRPESLHRERDGLSMQGSGIRFGGDHWLLTLDEPGAPFGPGLRGRIRILPESSAPRPLRLGSSSVHAWCPIASAARAEVELTEPALSFQGRAYLDCNVGEEPLEDGHRRWSWARTTSGGRTAVSYLGEDRAGRAYQRSVLVEKGSVAEVEAPLSLCSIGRTRWRLDAEVGADPGTQPARIARLEDGPFYTRSRVHASIVGVEGLGIQETLCLDRFRRRWVQALIPFRTRRR